MCRFILMALLFIRRNHRVISYLSYPGKDSHQVNALGYLEFYARAYVALDSFIFSCFNLQQYQRRSIRFSSLKMIHSVNKTF